MLRVSVRSTSIVLAIQCGFYDPGDSASFDCELKQVATLLRDGLVDPGGIGLPPSLNIQGGLRLFSREFYSPGHSKKSILHRIMAINPLIEQLEMIPNWRRSRAVQYPLWLMLLMTLLGVMSGYTNELATKVQQIC